jgi:PIN domain nuclease of toxin-antitoxin system
VNYLVDTHYLLWTLFHPDRIENAILDVLRDSASIKYVSGISLWEISLKYSLGKLILKETDPEEILEKTTESGFHLLSLENDLLATYFKLPKQSNHKDPFDRMLIWQAIAHDLVLITKDREIEEYVSHGLKVVMGK